MKVSKQIVGNREDFGQTATYLGTIEDHSKAFILDGGHSFEKDKPMHVCGNSADMLTKTRFAKHFKVTERGPHVGLFQGEACAKGGCC